MLFLVFYAKKLGYFVGKEDKREKSIASDISLIETLFAKQKKYHSEWEEYDRYYRARYRYKDFARLKKEKKSRLFIPVIRNIINITKAIFSTSFFSQGCPIEILPIGASDDAFKNALTVVTKHYYDITNPRKELSRAFWSAITLRLGVVISYWDTDKPVTRNVHLKDIAFDHEATNIDDVQMLAWRFVESGNDVVSKYKTKFYKENKEAILGADEDEARSKRLEVKEIIKKKDKGWSVRTFIGGKLAREATFERNPFQYGYAIDEYEYMDDAERQEQIMVYGCSLVWMLKEIQDEINIKRNQKNDIQEEQLNPTYLIGDGITINPAELRKGPGSSIRVKGRISPENIQQRPTPSDVGLNSDLAVLDKQDLEDASGINGIQRGGTSASDRRSAASLSIISANSSPRIEDMVMLLSDTLFSHWAKNFVHLVLKHASDDVVAQLTERDDYPLGKKGKRKKIDYNIKINFGASINKEATVQDLLSMIQMLLQSPNANPAAIDALIKKVLVLKLGENTDVNEFFGNEQTMSKLSASAENPNEAAENQNETTLDPDEEREKLILAQGGV